MQVHVISIYQLIYTMGTVRVVYFAAEIKSLCYIYVVHGCINSLQSRHTRI